jgi:RNA polymerase sigma factor (sigma-70 family)
MNFPDTRWTLISNLGDPEKVATALDQLCSVYWGPIYTYLLRSGRNHAEAQDLTQDFLQMVVRQRLLERADPAAGRLRSWLLSALQNFLANARRYESRQKRGPGAAMFALDEGEVIPELKNIASQRLSPDEAFDRAWIAVLLRRVMEVLAEQYRDAGKEADYQRLLPWLLDTGSISQKQAAIDAGMSLPNFRVQLHRLRGRYREILRQEVVATLERDEDYDAEIDYLFRIAGQQS